MSQHIVNEFVGSEITQDFGVSENKVLTSVYIGMYFHLDPAGSYRVQLYNGAELLLEKTLTLAEIIAGASWTAGQYHIGYILFDFDKYTKLIVGETYSLKIATAGYLYNDDSFAGLIIPHENKLNGSNDAYGFKLLALKEGGEMRIVDFLMASQARQGRHFQV